MSRLNRFRVTALARKANGHVEVAVYAGPIPARQVLVGTLTMRPDEVADLVEMINTRERLIARHLRQPGIV
jgi:hypothetical protein